MAGRLQLKVCGSPLKSTKSQKKYLKFSFYLLGITLARLHVGAGLIYYKFIKVKNADVEMCGNFWDIFTTQ